MTTSNGEVITNNHVDRTSHHYLAEHHRDRYGRTKASAPRSSVTRRQGRRRLRDQRRIHLKTVTFGGSARPRSAMSWARSHAIGAGHDADRDAAHRRPSVIGTAPVAPVPRRRTYKPDPDRCRHQPRNSRRPHQCADQAIGMEHRRGRHLQRRTGAQTSAPPSRSPSPAADSELERVGPPPVPSGTCGGTSRLTRPRQQWLTPTSASSST